MRALPELKDSDLDPIREAVAATVEMLGDTPLIGFAGAPSPLPPTWSKAAPPHHLHPRTMMHADPAAWHELAAWASRTAGQFLRAQIEAGASAVSLRLLGRLPR